MGRIPASQVAGLDLVDKLFFNQILVARVFDQEVLWLKNLDTDIERALTRQELTGSARQAIKHCVLCLMEGHLSGSVLGLREAYPGRLPPMPAGVSDEQFVDNERFKTQYFLAFVVAMLDKYHGCDITPAWAIVDGLLPDYADSPATFRYRLAERMFSLNFIMAPIDCLTWLARMGVLNSAKHPGVALERSYSDDFLHRLALLCDLDVIRDHVRRATGSKDEIRIEDIHKVRTPSAQTMKLLLEKHGKAMEARNMPHLKNSFPVIRFAELEQAASVQRYFSGLGQYATRIRTFQGTLASWTGMLCGGYIDILHWSGDGRAPIYTGEFNDGSLTDRLSRTMSRRGFALTPRSIYERHRDFKDTVLKAVTQYHQSKLMENVALPPDAIDIAYEALAPHFELLAPGPRRAAQRPVAPPAAGPARTQPPGDLQAS